jgi:hypothetical protein
VNEINPLQLEAMLEKAAERGAAKALHSLGLQDEDAAKDVVELRSLLESWRGVRTTMLNTFAAAVTMLILSFITVGAAMKFWDGKS